MNLQNIMLFLLAVFVFGLLGINFVIKSGNFIASKRIQMSPESFTFNQEVIKRATPSALEQVFGVFA